MKLLQQLFGLSLFGGKSRAKVIVNDSTGPPATANKTTQVASVACDSELCRQSAVVHVSRAVRDSDTADITSTSSSAGSSPPKGWSPSANRICWGSPSARRSAVWRGVVAADLGGHIRSVTRGDSDALPRSRSMIRTNPWLPPSSPATDRRSQFSAASGSGDSASCPPTPADSPSAESARRWRLVAGTDGMTPVASEGYCSVSSLCTTSDSATLSTTACSDDLQMSVDSLASLFPTLMSSSSTSFYDDKTSGSGTFCDSVVDSGIVVVSNASSASAVHEGEAQRHKEFDLMADERARASDDETQKNQHQTTSTLTRHLRVVQAALDRGTANDYDFDAELLPFGSKITLQHEKQQRPDLDHPACQQAASQSQSQFSNVQQISSKSRDVDEISSSLAASVERLRRGRAAVDGAFGRALAEDRRRQRELTQLRRRMVEAQRDVLLGTLKDLRCELDGQCRRLQAAYDVVLSSRWPRLHADTAYAGH